MIKVENIDVWGFEHAVRGMRNPMNSWDKSDSFMCRGGKLSNEHCGNCIYYKPFREKDEDKVCWRELSEGPEYIIGKNDLKLMRNLIKVGSSHRKFLRQIFVSMDITAPLYWWKEFDTYKIGVTANSCSTMHTIHEKEFTLDDFSCEHLDIKTLEVLKNIINVLNTYKVIYENYNADNFEIKGCPSQKDFWWQIIQLLPSSYNQRRTVTMNYENVLNIIEQRTNHKLDEWYMFVTILKNLPYTKELFN